MDPIHLEKIPHLSETTYSLDRIGSLMDEKCIFLPVDQVNWKNSCQSIPRVRCKIAYNEQALFLKFQVEETAFRAQEVSDNGNIWEDSCVEFFLQPLPFSPFYYNFEFNAIGALLIGCGTGRNDRILADSVITNSVRREIQLSVSRGGGKKDSFSWELTAEIPFTALFKTNFTPQEGTIVKANIYKCGNKLPFPHFLSWRPIHTEQPDFHRSEFFGSLIF